MAFVLGNLLHVSIDALVHLSRRNLLEGGPLRLAGVDTLPFDPADRVSPEEIAQAPLPEGFPHAEIRQVGEMVREMGTCDPKEILEMRLEMPLCRLVPRQRDITLMLYEEMVRMAGMPEHENRACLERPTSVAVGEVLAVFGDRVQRIG